MRSARTASSRPVHLHLSRRERQIMDIIYQLGEASVADVQERMPDDPAYDTVRLTLGTLKRKGYVQHRQEGVRYIYSPTISADSAKDTALRHLLKTFFDGSPRQLILSLMGMSSARLSKEDLEEIERWIEEEKDRGR